MPPTEFSSLLKEALDTLLLVVLVALTTAGCLGLALLLVRVAR
jgi:hypothetical protein